MYGYGGTMSPRMRPQTASPRAPGSPRMVPMPPPGAGSSAGSPRLTPRSQFGHTISSRPASACVRAGGRLYVQSPLQGMSENEMINEARIRLAHNKQRQRLKQLLATSANGGTVVQTKDLLLACRIAKLDVGTQNPLDADMFVKPEYVASRDCYGTPRAIAWKGFHKSIAYPELHPPGCFPGDLPLTRKQKQLFADYKAQQEAEAAAKMANDSAKAADAATLSASWVASMA